MSIFGQRGILRTNLVEVHKVRLHIKYQGLVVSVKKIFPCFPYVSLCKVSKGAKIRKRYNQVPHLTQDTNGKVTNSKLDTTNESQEVSPFPAGDRKAHINQRAQRHTNTRQKKHKGSTKEVPLGLCL